MDTPTDDHNGRLSPRDHRGKVVLAASCLAAAVTVAILALVDTSGASASVRRAVTMPVFFVNLFLTAAGSALGGFLSRGTSGRRVGAAILTSAAGIAAYAVCAVALAALVNATFGLMVFVEARR